MSDTQLTLPLQKGGTDESKGRRSRGLAGLSSRLVVLVIGFLLVFFSLVSVHVDEMKPGEFFVESLIPPLYWVGIIMIAGSVFSMIRYLGDRRFKVLFLVGSILLMISFRMVYPMTFSTIPAYEPDASGYINVVNSWASSGVDFGHEGNYHHDYPLSFLLAYAIIKMGVPVETFFRYAPFFIYAIDLLLVYLLVTQVSSDGRYGAVAAFLFSFSSMNYWTAVHYCPDLIGTLFLLLSLYLTFGLVKKGEIRTRTLMPVLLSVFLLILSHHLGILYFIVTVIGISFSAWMLQSPLRYKLSKWRWLLVIGVYAYTVWFAYGSFIYPSFFNIYVYIHGFTSATSLVQQATLLDNVTFVLYPSFILMLFLLEFSELFGVRSISDIRNLRKKLSEFRIGRTRAHDVLIYSSGFILVAFLFLAGFVIPATFPLRVLEVLMIGIYPLSARSFFSLADNNPSRKKTAVIFLLFLVVVITGVHRYYRQIQRRVLFG
jgi:hypothetical protein